MTASVTVGRTLRYAEGSARGLLHHERGHDRCRWQDCPSVYGPPTTIYNRFHRWAGRGLWQRLFSALVEISPGEMQMIDSTTAKVHRSAAGGNVWPARLQATIG